MRDLSHQIVERAGQVVASQREVGQIAEPLHLLRKASAKGVVARRQHLQGAAAGDILSGRQSSRKGVVGQVELRESGSADRRREATVEAVIVSEICLSSFVYDC